MRQGRGAGHDEGVGAFLGNDTAGEQDQPLPRAGRREFRQVQAVGQHHGQAIGGRHTVQHPAAQIRRRRHHQRQLAQQRGTVGRRFGAAHLLRIVVQDQRDGDVGQTGGDGQGDFGPVVDFHQRGTFALQGVGDADGEADVGRARAPDGGFEGDEIDAGEDRAILFTPVNDSPETGRRHQPACQQPDGARAVGPETLPGGKNHGDKGLGALLHGAAIQAQPRAGQGWRKRLQEHS